MNTNNTKKHKITEKLILKFNENINCLSCTDPTIYITMCCKQSVCKNCYTEWLKQKRTCMHCKQDQTDFNTWFNEFVDINQLPDMNLNTNIFQDDYEYYQTLFDYYEQIWNHYLPQDDYFDDINNLSYYDITSNIDLSNIMTLIELWNPVIAVTENIINNNN